MWSNSKKNEKMVMISAEDLRHLIHANYRIRFGDKRVAFVSAIVLPKRICESYIWLNVNVTFVSERGKKSDTYNSKVNRTSDLFINVIRSE